MQGIGNFNPLGALGGLCQAMKGLGDMKSGVSSFMEKLTQMPPNPLGAMMDFCKAIKGAENASQGIENATGMKMNPMEMLKNMLGIGQQGDEDTEDVGEGGGGGGGGKGGNSLGQMLDQMLPMLGMLQTMTR